MRSKMSFAPNRSMALAMVLVLASLTAQAAGVLDRIKAGGHLVLAHRDSSIPFSYLDADGKPLLDMQSWLLESRSRQRASARR